MLNQISGKLGAHLALSGHDAKFTTVFHWPLRAIKHRQEMNLHTTSTNVLSRFKVRN